MPIYPHATGGGRPRRHEPNLKTGGCNFPQSATFEINDEQSVSTSGRSLTRLTIDIDRKALFVPDCSRGVANKSYDQFVDYVDSPK